MKKILKKVLCAVMVYSLVVVITLILANRVEKLESDSDSSNYNTTVALVNS